MSTERASAVTFNVDGKPDGPVKDDVLVDADDTVFSSRTTLLSMALPQGFSRQDLRSIKLPAPAPQFGNPSPLGLLGFALATMVGGAQKLGLDEEGGSFISAVAMILGGVAQIIAGILCFYKNNTFSLTAFCGFGLHWFQAGLTLSLTLSGIYLPSSTYNGLAGVYYGLWTLFAMVLTVATLRINKVMTFTLVNVMLVFAFDIGAQFQHWAERTSGVFTVGATLGAVYLFAADLINELFGEPIIPLWPSEAHKDDFIAAKGYVPRVHYHKEATSSVVQ
eukprot:CAMPEP_0184751548 /NCGR_PEP_ID=MMETSP0315-20130426/43103_1 /TAXON_ID=101924 /ORGANISM="Rhodosorus marinus, Strain UTEX LB 2760" /LENGTH=277 /DNA_ID=CAMNT_0027230815 /DNA_START=129 /DNA_END=962 /DNA_ORIENTATION=-